MSLNPPFMFIKNQQHSQIRTTPNILAMMSLSRTISFINSILIIFFIAQLYVNYTHTRKFIECQDMIIMSIINIFWEKVRYLL